MGSKVAPSGDRVMGVAARGETLFGEAGCWSVIYGGPLLNETLLVKLTRFANGSNLSLGTRFDESRKDCIVWRIFTNR